MTSLFPALRGATADRSALRFGDRSLTYAELAAATGAPAAVFGLPDRGRVAPDLRADLVLVRGEPERDVTRTRAVEVVWRGGHPLGPPRQTRATTAW